MTTNALRGLNKECVILAIHVFNVVYTSLVVKHYRQKCEFKTAFFIVIWLSIYK